MREGWKCPHCGKAHGPHVDTCPGGGTGGIDGDGGMTMSQFYADLVNGQTRLDPEFEAVWSQNVEKLYEN